MSGRRAALASVVGGLVGGLIGAAVMSAGHAAITTIGGREPASAVTQEEDATVKVADRLSRIVRGRGLADSEKPAAGNAVHYGFGATMGLLYGAAAVVFPAITAGAGTGFGAAVWLGAHAIVVPALGLAGSPLQQPLSKEAIELVLHIAYGLTVGLVRRAAVRISR
jgi:putative membrane protein